MDRDNSVRVKAKVFYYDGGDNMMPKLLFRKNINKRSTT